MKKKIKDLTLEEFQNICDKHLCNNKCQLFGQVNSTGWYFCKKDDLDRYGNEEIEVEDDD